MENNFMNFLGTGLSDIVIDLNSKKESTHPIDVNEYIKFLQFLIVEDDTDDTDDIEDIEISLEDFKRHGFIDNFTAAFEKAMFNTNNETTPLIDEISNSMVAFVNNGYFMKDISNAKMDLIPTDITNSFSR